jgi:hypothetical protein
MVNTAKAVALMAMMVWQTISNLCLLYLSANTPAKIEIRKAEISLEKDTTPKSRAEPVRLYTNQPTTTCFIIFPRFENACPVKKYR